MKESIRTKWLAALRSGEYEQNRECLLRINNKFCCLGVLCEVVTPTQWEVIESSSDSSKVYRHYLELDDKSRIRSSINLPSGELMETVGLMTRSRFNKTGVIPVAHDNPLWDRLIKHPELSKTNNVESWRELGRIELTALNDAGLTFKEIADIIEEFIKADPEPVA
jgi:hypothetical protein